MPTAKLDPEPKYELSLTVEEAELLQAAVLGSSLARAEVQDILDDIDRFVVKHK